MTGLDQGDASVYNGSVLRRKKSAARRIVQMKPTTAIKVPITINVVAQLGNVLDALSSYDTPVELFVESMVCGVDTVQSGLRHPGSRAKFYTSSAPPGLYKGARKGTSLGKWLCKGPTPHASRFFLSEKKPTRIPHFE